MSEREQVDRCRSQRKDVAVKFTVHEIKGMSLRRMFFQTLLLGVLLCGANTAWASERYIGSSIGLGYNVKGFAVVNSEPEAIGSLLLLGPTTDVRLGLSWGSVDLQLPLINVLYSLLSGITSADTHLWIGLYISLPVSRGFEIDFGGDPYYVNGNDAKGKRSALGFRPSVRFSWWMGSKRFYMGFLRLKVFADLGHAYGGKNEAASSFVFGGGVLLSIGCLLRVSR